MLQWTVLALLCLTPLAYGQTDDRIRFFMITELGNTFEIAGPPPDRLPSFDSAPYLNMHRLDTALSLTAGGTAFKPPVATFGQAGSVTQLPEHDPDRSSMSVMLVTDWGHSSSRYLHSHFPVRELRTAGGAPYLGPGTVGNRSTADIIQLCNANGTGVSCVDNRAGRDVSAPYSFKYGSILDLPAAGRTIVHMANLTNIGGSHLEVFFTCPDCSSEARAYYGWGGGPFLERGFKHPDTQIRNAQPYTFGPGNLTGLAWGGVTDAGGITYWEDGGGCTPTLSITGSDILGFCRSNSLQAGTVEAHVWQPLAPGWNSAPKAGNSYVIVMDPGPGAKLQMRGGTERCCGGFDGGITNRASEAAVIHDTDRHLLVMPRSGHIPFDHPALNEMHHVRWETREDYRGTPRWLSHSEPGDPIYHGLLYDERGRWPPYMVRLVEAATIPFNPPDADVLDYLFGSNYTNGDLQFVLNIQGLRAGLLDSQIYDVRNDVRLLTDTGTFRMWDGTHVQREYVRPWMTIQKNPVWETYGVTLPRTRCSSWTCTRPYR